MDTTTEGYRLDPTDWDEFGRQMHELMDGCLLRMQQARHLPWRTPPAAMQILDGQPHDTASVLHTLSHDIMPYSTGNTHSAFFGWVHGTGIPIAVGAELVAATMNSNCGGRHHGATMIEAEVIRFLVKTADMDDTAFGTLTTGTSQATILALCAARTKCFGVDTVRREGIRNLPDVRVYVAAGAHSCIGKALEVMGHGSRCIREIPVDGNYQMNVEALRAAMIEDRSAHVYPLAVVGTAGSVGIGAYDNLEALADFCTKEHVWFHVDAAFGFWSRLAASPYHELSNGIGGANSIALDLHKWVGVPYDCGACLMADREHHRATFTTRPSYLESSSLLTPDQGLAGGDLWFCDYGIELSRGFKALKVWAAIRCLGTAAIGAAITDNCRQADLMGELVNASQFLSLQYPVISNVCCFSVTRGDVRSIAADLQRNGQGVLSTINLDGVLCLRAAIVGHRTTAEDIRRTIAAVEATQVS